MKTKTIEQVIKEQTALAAEAERKQQEAQKLEQDRIAREKEAVAAAFIEYTEVHDGVTIPRDVIRVSEAPGEDKYQIELVLFPGPHVTKVKSRHYWFIRDGKLHGDNFCRFGSSWQVDTDGRLLIDLQEAIYAAYKYSNKRSMPC